MKVETFNIEPISIPPDIGFDIDDKVECPKCTFLNTLSAYRCEACQYDLWFDSLLKSLINQQPNIIRYYEVTHRSHPVSMLSCQPAIVSVIHYGFWTSSEHRPSWPILDYAREHPVSILNSNVSRRWLLRAWYCLHKVKVSSGDARSIPDANH